MPSYSIDRADWESVQLAFTEFFEGRGEMQLDDDRASFRADITGFTIAADGTSESFMPLHTASMGWEEIEFDADAHEIRISGPAGSYTYVLPPNLRRAGDSRRLGEPPEGR